MVTKVEVSVKTLITIVLFSLSLWGLYLIRDVIVLLFISFILMSALSPLVSRLEKRGMPRALAVLIVYIVLILGISALFAAILPLFVNQIINLINNFPFYIQQIAGLFSRGTINNQEFFSTLSRELSSLSANIFSFTLSLFSGILSFATVAVLTFYLLLDEKNLKKRLPTIIPMQYQEQVMRILGEVQLRLGAWVRGQLILSLIVGTVYFVGLWILNVDFPLALGVMGGLLEVVPVMGPLVAAIPAVLIALTQSPILALAVIALFFVVQQLENHIIVPKVMQRAVGLPPLVIIIALLIGGRLFGIIGVILSVPIAVICHVILFDLLQTNNELPRKPSLTGYRQAASSSSASSSQ